MLQTKSGRSLLNSDELRLGDQIYAVQNDNRPWSLTTPEAGVLRFELRAGDVWYQDPFSKERTEIAGETYFAAGKKLSVSYEFRVADGDANTSNWLLIGQMHAIDNFSSPILAVELVGERLAIHLRYKLPGQDYVDWFAYVSDQDMVRGDYYRIDISVHMHLDDMGRAYVSLNGDKIVSYEGPLGYGSGMYWKQGIYRERADETIVVDYKNLSIEGEVGVRVFGTSAGDLITPRHRGPGQPKLGDDGDIVYGQAENDIIRGGAGDDLIFGGDDNDWLRGAKGDDTLIGGACNDRLKGGRGQDLFRFEVNCGRDVIVDFRIGEDLIGFSTDYFKSEEKVIAAMYERNGNVIIPFERSKAILKGHDIDDFQHRSQDFIFI